MGTVGGGCELEWGYENLSQQHGNLWRLHIGAYYWKLFEVFVDMKFRTFTIVKGANHWSELVGRFTDRLNTIADGFLIAGHTHYPNGVKIKKYSYPQIARELSNYAKGMGGDKCATLEELWSLCDKADCGFTRKWWWVLGCGKDTRQKKG